MNLKSRCCSNKFIEQLRCSTLKWIRRLHLQCIPRNSLSVRMVHWYFIMCKMICWTAGVGVGVGVGGMNREPTIGNAVSRKDLNSFFFFPLRFIPATKVTDAMCRRRRRFGIGTGGLRRRAAPKGSFSKSTQKNLYVCLSSAVSQRNTFTIFLFKKTPLLGRNFARVL